MSAGLQPAATLPNWRRRLEAVAISICGGLLWLLAVRYPATGPLLGPAFGMLLLPAAVERWRSPMFGFLPGQILFMFFAHLPGQRYGLAALVAFPLLATWSYSIQAVLVAVLRRWTRLPAWVTIPLAIGTGEWLRPWLDPGNFTMYEVGTFLFDYPVLIQVADKIGALALSVLYAVLLGTVVEAVRRRLSPDLVSPRSLIAGATISVLLTVAVVGYGTLQIGRHPGERGPRIAVIQPSLDHSRELTPTVTAEQQRMTARWVEPGGTDLVVWPENAILAPFPTDERYRSVAAWVARTREAPFLLGAQGFDPLGQGRPTNSAFLVAQDGNIVARYDKVVLFPFTERRVFPGLERFSPTAARLLVRWTTSAWGDAPNGWGANKAVPMRARLAGADWTFWTPICYETCFAEPARQARRDGARFFVNLTSEGWLGWGPTHNMLAVSVLRAVENRVGVVRCANSGISCFIRPSGRIDEVLVGREFGRRLLDQGALNLEVRAGSTEPTFYALHGGWIDAVWVAITTLLVLFLSARGIVRWREGLRKDPA